MVNAFRRGPSPRSSPARSAGSWCCDARLRRSHARGRRLPGRGRRGAARRQRDARLFRVRDRRRAAIALVPPRSGQRLQRGVRVHGTVQAFALACGLLFVSLYGGFLSGTDALLFGSFLGSPTSRCYLLLVVGAVALAVLRSIARPLFFAWSTPTSPPRAPCPSAGCPIAFLVLLGVAAAEVSQITGALLVSPSWWCPPPRPRSSPPARWSEHCSSRSSSGCSSRGSALLVAYYFAVPDRGSSCTSIALRALRRRGAGPTPGGSAGATNRVGDDVTGTLTASAAPGHRRGRPARAPLHARGAARGRSRSRLLSGPRRLLHGAARPGLHRRRAEPRRVHRGRWPRSRSASTPASVCS